MVDLEHSQIQDNLGIKPKAALSRCLVQKTRRSHRNDFSTKGTSASKYETLLKSESLNNICRFFEKMHICLYVHCRYTAKTCVLLAASESIQLEAKKRGKREDFGHWGS